VQLAPADNEPPEIANVVPIAVAEPPHVVDAEGVAANVTPLGSASSSASPESAMAPVAVFAIVTVSVEVPPA
jgi:hypothetical protein